MVKQLLLSLLLAASCFGQAFTMSDQPFLAALQGGAPTVQGCGSYTNGLLRYWKIDEGSGIFVTNYVGVPSIGGSLQTSPSLPLWSTNCPAVPIYIRNTNSLFFYNYDQYINCGDSSDYGNIVTGDYSISAWALYVTNGVFRNGEIIVEGRNSQNAIGGFHFSLGTSASNGVPVYAFNDATVGGYITGPPIATNESWTFLTVTRSGNTWTIYKDGSPSVSRTSANAQAYPDTPCWVTIGGPRFPDLGQPLNFLGLVADVRIYKNYALSSNEVWCLYHQYYGQ